MGDFLCGRMLNALCFRFDHWWSPLFSASRLNHRTPPAIHEFHDEILQEQQGLQCLDF